MPNLNIYKTKLINNLVKSLMFVYLNLLSFNLSAQVMPDQESVPGGIVKINLNISVDKNKPLPEAYFKNKKLMVYQHNGDYFALVGVPLKLKPGSYKIKYKGQSGGYKYKDFKIKNKKYKISRIKIKNKNMVTPNPKTQKRIMSDLKKIKTAVNNYSNKTPNDLILKQPVRGIPTTSFGARRIINGKSKNPHTGMDIAAATATPVSAAADGVVVLADGFYLSGNLVAVDHGSGFVTMYGHLSDILVKLGDKVKAGERIGRVGSTGRVTGPHLHWTVRLNQTPVNPDLFLEKINHKMKL